MFVFAISNEKIYFHIFDSVPHEKVSKMKLFQTHCPRFKKIYIYTLTKIIIRDMYTKLRSSDILSTRSY